MGMSELASSSGVSSLIKKQDNLIRGTANKTVRKEGISIFILNCVLFSVTQMFVMSGNYIWRALVVKTVFRFKLK